MIVIAVAIGTAGGMLLLWPGDIQPNLAAGLVAESEGAEVREVREFYCAGFATNTCRRVTVELASGPDEGRVATLELGTSGLDPELDVGDSVRVLESAAPPGSQPGAGRGQDLSKPIYTFADFERRRPMLVLAIVFVAIVLLFARLRGALSLAGLCFTLALVVLFMVPAILAGEPPLAVAIVGSLAVALVTIVLAHGWDSKSLAAILGTTASLLLIAGLAALFTGLSHLTGLSSEEAAVLQLNRGGVQFEGLLLAGMVIGALGVLDDVTISQASTVMALRRANPALGFGELFRRALGVGRDHVTATVNTLMLAYVGASLPLLLLFSAGELPFGEVLNLELVAKEVVATLVGSIGLIAAVPITTALAAILLERPRAGRLVSPAG